MKTNNRVRIRGADSPNGAPQLRSTEQRETRDSSPDRGTRSSTGATVFRPTGDVLEGQRPSGPRSGSGIQTPTLCKPGIATQPDCAAAEPRLAAPGRPPPPFASTSTVLSRANKLRHYCALFRARLFCPLKVEIKNIVCSVRVWYIEQSVGSLLSSASANYPLSKFFSRRSKIALFPYFKCLLCR